MDMFGTGRIVAPLAAAAALVLAGCGDPETTDPRPNYTKAPLERPGLIIQGEERTEMDRLGQPILIPVLAQEEEASDSP